jgi:hypothetical protein
MTINRRFFLKVASALAAIPQTAVDAVRAPAMAQAAGVVSMLEAAKDGNPIVEAAANTALDALTEAAGDYYVDQMQREMWGGGSSEHLRFSLAEASIDHFKSMSPIVKMYHKQQIRREAVRHDVIHKTAFGILQRQNQKRKRKET